MTKEQIITMAREAGVHIGAADGRAALFWYPEIERFAQLVAASEREKCAEVCDKEAAFYGECGWVQAASNCATAIRALGDEK